MMVENDNNIEKEKKNRRKTEKLIFILGFTMIIFVVATYAWFIGLSVARVNTFEVKIQSSEGLSLSLDGENFVDEISLGNTESDVLNNVLKAYNGTTSSWLGVTQDEWLSNLETNEALEAKETTELVPVSIKGEMRLANETYNVAEERNASSVLEIFSKTSMTSSGGGYSLRADPLINYKTSGEPAVEVADEQPGYVVFNLFIKNKVNTTYKREFDSNSDEAIYLTRNSGVRLMQSSEFEGESTGGDGLENSIRIAFMQVGRVAANSNKDIVTGITCKSDSNVTGLCNAYTEVVSSGGEPAVNTLVTKYDRVKSNNITYAIWEPNDKLHTSSSIAHFGRICKKRTTCTYDAEHPEQCPQSGLKYDTEQCDAIAANTYKATYPVSKRIVSDDNVDIYDGLNGYTAHSSDERSTPLTSVEYYTDTENQKGDTRKQFFSLAPNSITLVRIYIYLEGQDVDNYDISSLGKAFFINFGFTKDRYEEDEIDPGEIPHNEVSNVDNGETP